MPRHYQYKENLYQITEESKKRYSKKIYDSLKILTNFQTISKDFEENDLVVVTTTEDDVPLIGLLFKKFKKVPKNKDSREKRIAINFRVITQAHLDQILRWPAFRKNPNRLVAGFQTIQEIEKMILRTEYQENVVVATTEEEEEEENAITLKSIEEILLSPVDNVEIEIVAPPPPPPPTKRKRNHATKQQHHRHRHHHHRSKNDNDDDDDVSDKDEKEMKRRKKEKKKIEKDDEDEDDGDNMTIITSQQQQHFTNGFNSYTPFDFYNESNIDANELGLFTEVINASRMDNDDDDDEVIEEGRVVEEGAEKEEEEFLRNTINEEAIGRLEISSIDYPLPSQPQPQTQTQPQKSFEIDFDLLKDFVEKSYRKNYQENAEYENILHSKKRWPTEFSHDEQCAYNQFVFPFFHQLASSLPPPVLLEEMKEIKTKEKSLLLLPVPPVVRWIVEALEFQSTHVYFVVPKLLDARTLNEDGVLGKMAFFLLLSTYRAWKELAEKNQNQNDDWF